MRRVTPWCFAWENGPDSGVIHLESTVPSESVGHTKRRRGLYLATPPTPPAGFRIVLLKESTSSTGAQGSSRIPYHPS